MPISNAEGQHGRPAAVAFPSVALSLALGAMVSVGVGVNVGTGVAVGVGVGVGVSVGVQVSGAPLHQTCPLMRGPWMRRLPPRSQHSPHLAGTRVVSSQLAPSQLQSLQTSGALMSGLGSGVGLGRGVGAGDGVTGDGRGSRHQRRSSLATAPWRMV